jgi:hypothetical protein
MAQGGVELTSMLVLKFTDNMVHTIIVLVTTTPSGYDYS